jgi:N-acetylmuramoyl-L-alanine amidase
MAILRRDIARIRLIIIHCSASDNPEHDDISVIRKWHKEKGYDDVGYHYFIRKNGVIQKGRKLFEVGAHCKNHNSNTVGICLSGNKKFTSAQFKAAALIVHDLDEILPNLMPNPVYPHSFFDENKTCPNFPIKEILKYSDAQLSSHREFVRAIIDSTP